MSATKMFINHDIVESIDDNAEMVSKSLIN